MRIAMCVLAVVMVAGCKSDEELLPPPVLATPLPLDPTEQYELARWWSNGEQMLRLDRAGSYALYNSTNRYRPPAERGTWDKQSYASIWLRPYSAMPRSDTRVAISKLDGELALQLGTLKPMRAIEEPVKVVEDELVGAWSAPHGVISLESNMRYTFLPSDGARGPGGHSGLWRVVNDTVTLRPDSPSVHAVTLAIRRNGDAISLDSQQGQFLPQAR
jgi:hypothetical protein